jgi:hypothetical protein
LQNLGGLAQGSNRRICGKREIPWETKFADVEALAVQIGRETSREMIELGVGRQAVGIPREAESCSWRGVSVEPTDANESSGDRALAFGPAVAD